MKTIPFGQRNDFIIPIANIGAMRLPRDVDDAVALIRHAIDSGMRYIDTSRGYGESEWILGQALKDGYRKKVILSTKWSPWITKIRPDDEPTSDHVRRRLEESMRRLQVEYLDFYQVWNIDSREHYDQAIAPGGMVEGILKARDEGLIGHTGFTTHDEVDNIITYVEEADWCEIILFTYNLLNRRYAPAIEAAHRKGIGTIVMNPVGGGKLTETSSKLMQIAREVGATSVPDLAIRYILGNPAVDTIICGMTKTGDVDDTIASATAGGLTSEQREKVDQFLDQLDTEKEGFCTKCKYCMPCPQGIDIPAVMECIFDERVLGLANHASRRYKRIRGAKADACSACGKCEPACTQNLSIQREMLYAAQHFGED